MPAPCRPHLLIRSEPGSDPAAGEGPGLRTLDELRQAVGAGHAARLWQGIRRDAEADIGAEPLTAFAALPDRSGEDIRQGNRDYIVVHAAGTRVLRAALALHLTGDRRFRDVAMAQISCLYDGSAWEEWQDIFHRRAHDLDADLRTGQLCRDLGLAFDWLYPFLSPADRTWMVEGLDRRGIQPYLQAVADGAWWRSSLHNWTTVIVGGLGICGMALRDHHPQADELVADSLPLMDRYMDQYGPAGEFKENPSYANASALPAMYFAAHRYYSEARETPGQIAALQRHCYWSMYATAPPGELVSFGDGGPGYPAHTSFFPAVAAATQDPVLQWFYLTHCRDGESKTRHPVWELLWYDAGLEPRAPTVDDLPLGRAFPAHSGLVSSRTSWNPVTAACVVFGKAGHGGVNHSHPDAGQVEIHGHGRRLITDLGSVPYPASDARQYYHFASEGHNVVALGGRPLLWDRQHRSELVAWDFDKGRGGWWQIDVTALHEGAVRVRRTVVHLLPGVVAVLDEVVQEAGGPVRLRWHTGAAPRLGRGVPGGPSQVVAGVGGGAGSHGGVSAGSLTGAFSVDVEGVALAALIASPEAHVALSTGRHQYCPPYDRDRMGNLLPQRREPYVDAEAEGPQLRLLSLFAVTGPGEAPRAWVATNEQIWSLGDGPVQVGLADDRLIARGGDANPGWEVELD